jgi:hypothetical protein
LRRRLQRELLWHDNVEPALWTVVTERDHIVRWAWRTHAASVAQQLQDQKIQAGLRPGVRRWAAATGRARR